MTTSLCLMVSTLVEEPFHRRVFQNLFIRFIFTTPSPHKNLDLERTTTTEENPEKSIEQRVSMRAKRLKQQQRSFYRVSPTSFPLLPVRCFYLVPMAMDQQYVAPLAKFVAPLCCVVFH
mmetsp:Transcript_15330/g.31715  ORF Transcript_15330/g.31715 Transcript_15330/m.31715 type:complete len:119 (-) Transcript_15330:327-683(-)